MRVAEPIEPDAQTERELRVLSKGRRVEARVQQRARVILLAAQGWQNKDIADEVRLDRRQVALWRRRFIEGGLPALLQDALRTGRTPSVSSAVESHILSTTLHEQPAAAAQWSTRTLASYLGLSATTVRRVWQRNGVRPHLPQADEAMQAPPRFENALVDVMGLYMGPREHVLVLGCEERGPGRAPARIRAGATGEDHRRHGVAALFPALRRLDGAVLSRNPEPHHGEEWLRFLRRIDRRTPAALRLHLVVENQAALRHPMVQAWLARHPRWAVRSIPANASWLNEVRRYVRGIVEHRIRAHSFSQVADLMEAIAQFIEHRGRKAQPFVWTARTPGDAAPAGGGR